MIHRLIRTDWFWNLNLQQLFKSLLPYLFDQLPNISSMAQHVFHLANDMLFTTHDTIYHGTRLGRSRGSITRYVPELPASCGKSSDTFHRQDKEHHPPTFDRWSPLTMTPYPSNAAIKSRSVLPNAREAGIHDLRGTDPIWAGARSEEHTSELQSLV